MDQNTEQLHKMRHSLAHIMANAIQRTWPKAKFGVGPVIENGFYYDIDLGDSTLSENDLKQIESKMADIIKADEPFELIEMGLDEAIEWAKRYNQPYKLELLHDLQEKGTTSLNKQELDGESFKLDKGAKTVTFYRNGDFTDLCRGPHLKSTGMARSFKLTKTSGAYWRGKESNPQMQRIYGVAFNTQEELDNYLEMAEESKKRDHRKLGQALDLFVFSDLVGSGLPLYTPRGTVLIEELKKALRDMSKDYDMDLVSIPHMAKLELYEISGHAGKFADELFHVKSHYDQPFVLKPVNCPHHTQIYASRPRSYRDLPIRYIEQTMQYRDEKPGEIGGLQRTRGFTVDDGHTFCTTDQIKQEVETLIKIAQQFYESLGLWGKHWVSLSVRDLATPEKYIGEPKDWDKAESILTELSEKLKLGAKRMEGEAAIYGPKLDFMFKDALGRETQLATIQLDFAMPKRFGLSYIDQTGQEQVPVMIHRAILGSFERFMMLLIEHFAGNFPVWLAPEQVRVITVNQEEKIVKFADSIGKKAKELGIRLSIDNSNESVGKKIRNSELLKIPYTLIVGDNEFSSGEFTPRIRNDLKVNSEDRKYNIDELLSTVANEYKSRVLHSSL